MRHSYSWDWVQAQVTRTIAEWNACPSQSVLAGPVFSAKEQRRREQAYDEALRAAEREARRVPRSRAQRLEAQDRMTEAFARFSGVALDLDDNAIQLLTDDFLPAGTKLAQWARQFDASLSMADIVQACRNAWTACGLQPLLGEEIRLTPSILGYSLLYPYSDNYLDGEGISSRQKLEFSERFRERLRGERIEALSRREAAVWSLVALIEDEFPRQRYPQVFDCLLAIHRAQEESIAQQRSAGDCDAPQVLRISCAKGGSSVLADACLSHGWLNEQESEFAFDWGVLLQLGDDLQDVREDARRGSVTLFSRAALAGTPLDGLATRLLNFSERVSDSMDGMRHGTAMLKGLLRMSWRSLIVMAMADSREFFTMGFLAEAERHSPFRFEFLRARRDRLAGRRGLFATLFEAFLEPRQEPREELREGDDGLPFAADRIGRVYRIAVDPVTNLTAL
ncbi:MAG: hypothetical protein WBE76_20575 [Terracidiphilus sp.]